MGIIDNFKIIFIIPFQLPFTNFADIYFTIILYKNENVFNFIYSPICR